MLKCVTIILRLLISLSYASHMIRRGTEILITLICTCVTGIAIFASGAYPSLPTTPTNLAPEVEVGKLKDMNNFRAVFVTTPNIEVAKKIAHGLVSNKLAACVNIIPQVTSVYEWEGKINEDAELILMIKTQQDKFDQVDKFVRENHPYSVPEVIAVPIEQGSEKCLQWIKDTIGGTSSS